MASGRRSEFDRELALAAAELFPPRYERYGKHHLRALLRLITAVDRFTNARDALTPFTLQKAGDEVRTDVLPALEPYSVNRGGFVAQQLPRILDQLETQGLIERQPSPLNDVDAPVIRPADCIGKHLPVSDRLINDLQQFLAQVDPRQFFTHHDKTRVYPRVTDESRYIGVDGELVAALQANTAPVDDPQLYERLRERDRDVWETQCDRQLRPVLLPTYVISKTFKNLYVSDAAADLTTPVDSDYIERTLNIKPLREQCGPAVDGEVVWLNGMFDANAMTPVDAAEGTWRLAEYPGGATVRVAFGGDLEFPDHQLYDYALGVLGVVRNRDGTPVVQAAAIIKNGELSEPLRDAQTRGLTRLGTTLDQEVLAQQADIERLLRSVLEEGDLAGEDKWLVFDILDRIQDLTTLHDIIDEIVAHERSDEILRLLADHLDQLHV